MKTYTIKENKVIETTSVEYDRNIDFNDIVDEVNVEPESESFFDFCDYLKHKLVKISHYEAERMGWGSSIIRLDGLLYNIEMDNGLFDGIIEYHKNNGCSKQVAFEKLAENKKDSLRMIKDILKGRKEFYQLSLSFMGFTSYTIGMVDKDETEEYKKELALEVVSQMEEAGFIIENKPKPYSKKDAFKLRLKRNLEA